MRDTTTSTAEFPGFGRTAVEIEQGAADQDAATAQTVARLRRWILGTARDPIVRQATAEAIAGASDQAEIAERIFWWLVNHVRVIADAQPLEELLGMGDALELLVEPRLLLTMSRPAGDCDDFVMAAGAMLLSAGVPCELVTIAADPSEPRRWSHIYCLAHTDQGVIPLDASHGAYPGWEAPEYFRRREWGILYPSAARPSGRLNGYQSRGLAAGGTSSGQTSTPWWEGALTAGLDIAKARYGQPPVGTYISTPQGTYSRQALPFPSAGIEIRTPMGMPTISPTTVLVGVGALALVVVALAAGRRR